MNNQQLQQAIQMHEAGINYAVIAAYFKLCPNTLRKQLKDYETPSPNITTE